MSPNDMTFWKTTYPRHTNFAVAEVEIPFNNTAGMGRQKIQAKISRSGDLLYSMYLYVELPQVTYTDATSTGTILQLPGTTTPNWGCYVDAVGNALIQQITCNIGAHDMDDQYGETQEIWEAVAAPSDRLLSEMTGRYDSVEERIQAAMAPQILYVPTRFWFNRFTEQALPMVALYWHDVEITLQTAPASALTVTSATTSHITMPTDVNEMHFLCNFVYLDRPERAAFANAKSEYIIDQWQFLGAEAVRAGTAQANHSIRYNHPCMEILWVCQRDAAVTPSSTTGDGGQFDWSGVPIYPQGQTTLNVGRVSYDPFLTAQIFINNHQRTIEHPAVYYRLVQAYQSHSRLPFDDRWVYSYAFGLKPEELLHNGSVNMSRMDNAQLRVTYPPVVQGALNQAWDGQIRIYARNKNVMKVTVGMAGLKFAA